MFPSASRYRHHPVGIPAPTWFGAPRRTGRDHPEGELMNIVEPAVQLLAHTAIVPDAVEQRLEIQEGSTDAETLPVYAGRSCYESWSRPSEKTREDKDYLRRTLFEQGHFSILEHASATFYLTGVSRALLAEITRHRHLSFSVMSQRFVDESDANIVIPPAAAKSDAEVVLCPDGPWEDSVSGLPFALQIWGEDAMWGYDTIVYALTDDALPRQQARAAARAVLPNMVETRIVVTGNLRAWHEVIERRTAPDADAEFQLVAGLIRDELRKIAPEVFPEP